MLRRLLDLVTGLMPLVYFLATATDASADYVHQTLAERSGTIMEWHIEDDQVKLILEIDQADKAAFPLILGKKPEMRFLKGANQQPLSGQVTILEPRERILRFDPNQPAPVDIRGNPIPLSDLSPTVTYAEIVYPLNTSPEQLTLVPPLALGKDRADSAIGFIVFHDQIPVTNYWYLSQAETLNLDWEDPWYSTFENRNLKRPHQSSVTSYLYVEPYEVRHEIIIRLQDLAPWLGVEMNRNTLLKPEDLKAIEEKAIQWFTQRPTTTIDGAKSQPIVDQVQFLSVDSRGVFQVLPKEQPQEAVATILGITLAFPTDGIPEQLNVEWDLFSDRIQSITARATDPAGPFPYTLTPENKTLVWNNFLKNYELPSVNYLPVNNRIKLPIGTFLGIIGAIAAGIWLYKKRHKTGVKVYQYALPVGCLLIGIITYPITQVGIGGSALAIKPLSEAEAEIIFNYLLGNIYRAMDFREESDIYDKLALSLEGDLLTEIYLQNQRSMTLEDEGGAIATVKKIEILDVTKDNSGDRNNQLAFRTRWIASGTLQHWGHNHNRTNQYEALLTLAPVEDNWKITDIELLEEFRLQ